MFHERKLIDTEKAEAYASAFSVSRVSLKAFNLQCRATQN